MRVVCRRYLLLLTAAVLALAACAPPQAGERVGQPGERAAAGPRTLVMAVNTEVANLAPKAIGPTNPERTTRILNAALALIDGRGEVRPYLAEALPRLNSDTWRVFPDGRMETTWVLRPALTWHDGQPLTADDFVFAWRVYTAPGLGVFTPKPQDRVEEMRAVDSLTLLIRWRSTYPGAAAITNSDLDPLPRHILEGPFAAFEQDPATREAFLGQRFWTTEYVGAGPFRATGWEPGSHLEAVAFDGHALGRPKIDRVVVRFIGDENTVLTNILAESVHYTMGQALRFEQAMVLRGEWAANRRGVVLPFATSTATAAIQFRPEHLRFPALMDVRARRALAHSLDREALNEGLFEGQGRIIHTHVAPEQPYFPEVDRAIIKYPYDLRRTEQLMNEAGFRKDRDGMFASEAGERFQPTYWVTGGTQTERQLQIVTDAWRRAGIDLQPYVIPVAQARDNQVRSTFPGMLSYGVSPSALGSFETFTSGQIGTAANRWGGQNRGGWSNADYDRLFEGYTSTLEPNERVPRIVEMMTVLSQELPNYPQFPNLGAVTHLSVVRGPEVGTPETLVHWNIHGWELV